MDNLETILQPGAPAARYREGYAGYGEVLRRVGESVHQGCLLLTGREAPPELAPLAGQRRPVRTLSPGLVGLGHVNSPPSPMIPLARDSPPVTRRRMAAAAVC